MGEEQTQKFLSCEEERNLLLCFLFSWFQAVTLLKYSMLFCSEYCNDLHDFSKKKPTKKPQQKKLQPITPKLPVRMTYDLVTGSVHTCCVPAVLSYIQWNYLLWKYMGIYLKRLLKVVLDYTNWSIIQKHSNRSFKLPVSKFFVYCPFCSLATAPSFSCRT